MAFRHPQVAVGGRGGWGTLPSGSPVYASTEGRGISDIEAMTGDER